MERGVLTGSERKPLPVSRIMNPPTAMDTQYAPPLTMPVFSSTLSPLSGLLYVQASGIRCFRSAAADTAFTQSAKRPIHHPWRY
ncbi:hypothetical protein VTN00DRAFT_7036 [Thermoascus crustaceus]|uniref:uncharacterized protein n=1 Tax=Thermoascus crustaceus TaxID=5088 RepID=UPI003743F001